MVVNIPQFPQLKDRVRQRNLSRYGIITDSATKENLDEQIVRLFYSCNLAFNIADNQIFKDTIYILNCFVLVTVLHL